MKKWTGLNEDTLYKYEKNEEIERKELWKGKRQ